MRTQYIVLSAILLMTMLSPAFSQEQYISVLAGGGLAIPAGPDFFSSQWETGFNVGVDVGYALDNSITVGGTLEYDHFHRTPNCVYGADRDFIIFGGFARFYPAPRVLPLYGTLYAGMAYDLIGGIVRRRPEGTYTNNMDPTLNPMVAARVGGETMINRNTTLIMEGGYSIVFGPFSNSEFLVLRLGAHWRI